MLDANGRSVQTLSEGPALSGAASGWPSGVAWKGQFSLDGSAIHLPTGHSPSDE